MVKTMTNAEMLVALDALAAGANEKGKLGYAIARNRRKIADAAVEYTKIRDELLMEYGVDNQDGTYQITTKEALKAIQDGLAPYADISHEVEIMVVPGECFCESELTSQQMFMLEFMVEDESETNHKNKE